MKYDILIHRLKHDHGIEDSAQNWSQSYLHVRDQRIRIGNAMSTPTILDIGVPQRSGSGPRPYTRYTIRLGTLIWELILLFHLFADDAQVFKELVPNSIEDQQEARTSLENGVEAIGQWMHRNHRNKLYLNKDKTEFIMIGSKQQLRKMSYSRITISGEDIECSKGIRNLGCYFDCDMKMGAHVNHIVQVGYYRLRQLFILRKSLTQKSLKTLIVSLIFSKLNYCNALLYGIPDELIEKLQKLQNACARLVTGFRKVDHITDALRSLHWLKIKYRIDFKIILWVY